MKNILLKSKVQVIYFKSNQDELGISYATSEKRITIEEADGILKDRDIEFDEILKVKYEDIELEIPLYDLQSYIKN